MAASGQASTIDSAQPSASLHRHRTWPWRKHVTPLDQVYEHQVSLKHASSSDFETAPPGYGTDSSPYALDWIPSVAIPNPPGVEGDMAIQIRDPEYPQNWPMGYKWGLVAIGALSVLSVTMTSSMMSAAIYDIRKHFPGHTAEMYIMITSVFVLGFVVGPLLWAPCSEVFGRRRMFIATFVPFTIFNAACCGANSLEALLVFRFFAGTFGSSSLTSVGGIISDMFSPATRAGAMGIFAIAPFLGPAIGPVAGGFLAEAQGSSWKWVAALLAFFSAILTVAGAIWLPETYEPVLLRRRARNMEKAYGGRWAYHRDVEKPLRLKELFMSQLKTPWKILFLEPIAFLMALYLSVVYAILYMQFTSFPIVFVQQRGWSPSIGGLAFIGLSIGAVLGLVLLGVMNKRYSKKLEEQGGFLPPEERLPMVILGGILLPAGLFWFAWTSPAHIHWIVPILATVVFGAALVGLFLGVMSYLVDAYTLYAASTLAGNTVMRSIFGVCFPLFTPKMYANLGVSWAGTVVGFIALIFIPAPILFYKYGKRIRMSSRYAREADAVARRMAEKFQREKLLGTPSASAGGATRRNSVQDQDLPLETADDQRRSLSLSEAKLRGDHHNQVDVEKAGAAANVHAADRRQMPQQKPEEERDVASIRDVRVGGEADAMALPAVQQARSGTADELRYERK